MPERRYNKDITTLCEGVACLMLRELCLRRNVINCDYKWQQVSLDRSKLLKVF